VIFWEKWNAPKIKQSYIQRIKNKIRELLVSPIVKRTDACISVGDKSYANFVTLGATKEKIGFVHDSTAYNYAFYETTIYDKYKIPRDKKIILYLGRIIKRKGADILIKAFNLISEKMRLRAYVWVKHRASI
jgi:glycosyltransferase involved in cell wall biosynthesis